MTEMELYMSIRVSQKMKSVICLSVDLSIFCFGGTNRQIWNLSTCWQISRFVFFQQIVDLVPNFYVGFPLGDLNPLSYPRLKKNMISTLMPALCVRIILNHAFPSCSPVAIGEYWQWLFTSTPWRNEWGNCIRWPVILSLLDYNGWDHMSEECFFLREEKKDRQADRFHCKSGKQNSNIHGNFKKSKSVDRFCTKIDRSTDEQMTDFIFWDTLLARYLHLYSKYVIVTR
jgi:hypothetical protein